MRSIRRKTARQVQSAISRPVMTTPTTRQYKIVFISIYTDVIVVVFSRQIGVPQARPAWPQPNRRVRTVPLEQQNDDFQGRAGLRPEEGVGFSRAIPREVAPRRRWRRLAVEARARLSVSGRGGGRKRTRRSSHTLAKTPRPDPVRSAYTPQVNVSGRSPDGGRLPSSIRANPPRDGDAKPWTRSARVSRRAAHAPAGRAARLPKG
jgi:hypothetical protein